MSDAHVQDREKERQEQDKRITEQLSRIKQTFLVMSGKGGVGKSTVAVNLAAAMADRGYSVGLMDVDLHGPSTVKMLGLEGEPVKMSGQRLLPIPYGERMKVVSMAALLEDRDTAVIWRGPLKIGAIKQFISDVLWGELDYLFIDSPPGTGDEPLTVAQVVKGARGIIVTTPQEISLLDIRKSITFCRQLDMPVFGVLENMSGLICPHCGQRIDLFSTGGGERTAREMGVPFLGRIPIRPEIVVSTDGGQPYVLSNDQGKEDFKVIIDKLEQGGKK
ncbi:MAG: Mrp/NBP35 family ATP-binding protein [Spirochaetales bacterium]|nr:Mrp/NBP35 family ATP-binding protein [Spirochaetales bacterium]